MLHKSIQLGIRASPSTSVRLLEPKQLLDALGDRLPLRRIADLHKSVDAGVKQTATLDQRHM